MLISHLRGRLPLAGLCVFAWVAGIACGDSDGDGGSNTKNEAGGQPCHLLETSFQCTEVARMCYAAGSKGSSCPGGVLCAGDGKGMTCAYSCSVDADCAGAGPDLVCMQECKARVVNGYCVRPELRTLLLETVCPTSTLGTSSVAGVSNF